MVSKPRITAHLSFSSFDEDLTAELHITLHFLVEGLISRNRISRTVLIEVQQEITTGTQVDCRD